VSGVWGRGAREMHKAARLAGAARGHELSNLIFYTHVWCLDPRWARNASGGASGWSRARTRVEQPYSLHSRLASWAAVHGGREMHEVARLAGTAADTN
jgi:hypothetical protein